MKTYGPFKCGYCGRYGQPGACAGCGAPNAPPSDPAFGTYPAFIVDAVCAGVMTPNEARSMVDRPVYDPRPQEFVIIPNYDWGKR